ncbi:ribonuclease H-like domain-containing protein [Tanacetum coccineum]
MTHPSPKRNKVPKATLMRSSLVSLTTARTVNTAQPRTIVNSARRMTNVFNKAHSTVRMPINNKTTTKNINFNKRVNTISGKNVNTTRLKVVVNAARPKAVLNVVKGNQVNAVKASACWVWKPKTKGNPHQDLEEKVMIDSECSRHMTGNMSYLNDFEEIDGGYIAFGGNPKEGKITSRDDYSRFSCVFLLATKDETSGILKSFITGVENLIDQRVKGEYDMWRLRIELYFQVQDYALWDVIENRNSFKLVAQTTTNFDGTSTSLIPGLVTTKEKAQKKNDVKSRSMLLMALPNEHLMTFNQYKDVKTLFATIQTRFGEDLNLKFLRSLPSEWNTHVVVWRNKPDLDTMSFDDLYNNFKIVKQEVKGSASSSSSLSYQNMAFVSSPSSTNEVNNAYGVSTTNTQVSTTNTQVSPASTQVSTASTQVSIANLSDDTVYAFLARQPNGSQLVYEDLEQIHEDDIEEMDLKWQLALLSMRTRRFFQKTSRKITINGSDTTGYDKSKVECFNCHKMGHLARECRGPRKQDNRNKIKTTLEGLQMWKKLLLKPWWLLMELFNLATYKRGLPSVEEQLVFYKKNEVILCEQLAILKKDISYKDSEISMLKSELEKIKQEKESNQLKIENFDNASKSLDKLIGSQIPEKSRKGVGFVSYNVVPPPPIGLFLPPNLDLSYSGIEEFQQPEFKGYGPKSSKSVSEDISNEVRKSPDGPLDKGVVLTAITIKGKGCGVLSRNNYTMVNYNYFSKKSHPSAHRNMVPREVLMKSGLRSLNTPRPVNTAHPKTIVYSARPMSHFSKSAQSTVKRPYQIRISLTNKFFSQKVNTAKGKFYTARPNSAVVNAVRANQVNVVKASVIYKKKIKAMLIVDAQST